MSCVNKVIEHVREKLDRQLSLVHIVSDKCTNSRFVFNLLIHFQRDLQLELNYNEAFHGKGPMQGLELMEQSI